MGERGTYIMAKESEGLGILSQKKFQLALTEHSLEEKEPPPPLPTALYCTVQCTLELVDL